MRVSEIFYSLQGEAQAAGLPCCFVRLAGCPFRCTYCDTAYAREEAAEEATVESILERLRVHSCRLVEVTGGEPLAQAETPALLQALSEAGWSVMLETSGHLPLDRIPPSTAIVMDIKTPGSGHPGFHAPNLARLTPRDAVKFVLCDRNDFDWACARVRELDLAARVPIFLSPAWGVLQAAELADWILDEALPGVRLQLPLHKVLWGNGPGR